MAMHCRESYRDRGRNSVGRTVCIIAQSTIAIDSAGAGGRRWADGDIAWPTADADESAAHDADIASDTCCHADIRFRPGCGRPRAARHCAT
eukprot:COSAG01_NODE_959_length_12451_cov_18.389815_16_plen_91_part_00